MLSKLSALGICGKNIAGSKRTLKVESNSAMFRAKNHLQRIDCFIPQGSFLEPLPFIIYINDFERCLQGATHNIYADDTSIAC